MRLVACRHIRRTHGAGELLATSAHSTAHLHRAAHAAVVGEIEEGVENFGGLIAHTKAQIVGERRRIDDLPGIENPLRVRGALDLAKRFVNALAKHLPDEGAANQSVAVLTGKRSAVLEHQVGDFVGDGLEGLHSRFGLETDSGANVQTAHRGVCIDTGRGAVLLEDLQKFADEGAEFFGRNGGVFHEGDRFRIILHGGRKA